MSDPTRHLAWDDFRLVRAIAAARGLTGAAAALGVNHSTVFRRLAQIERGLGTALFERHRSGYVPSPVGAEMIALAERLDADITAFDRRLAGRDAAPSGDLRLATNDALLVELLTPVLAGFRLAFPDVRLEIVVGNEALNLARRDADVAIRATDSPPDTLVGRRLATIAWCVYGRAADGPGLADPTSWPTRSWIGPGGALSGGAWMGWFEERGIAPERLVYRLDSVLGLAGAVEAGIGLAPLPCFVGDRRPALARLAPPDPGLAAGLWLLTHADLRGAARVRAFMDYAGAAIGQQRALIEGRAGPAI